MCAQALVLVLVLMLTLTLGQALDFLAGASLTCGSHLSSIGLLSLTTLNML